MSHVCIIKFRTFLFLFFLIFFSSFGVLKIKYVGDEQEKRSLNMTGLNLMDKTLVVQGARISFSIWDVGGMHLYILIYYYFFFFFFLLVGSCNF